MNTSGVLATLVKVQGSSYRTVGARLLCRSDGTRVGSISGGCLEEDLILRANAVQKSGNTEVVVYDTTSENDLVWGVGLGCHGVVHLVLERTDSFAKPLALIEEAWAQRKAVVIATAFEPSAPEKSGLLGVWNETGEWWARSAHLTAEFFAPAKKTLVSCQSHYTSAEGLNILWEYRPPPLALKIFGAGDDVQPLARFAKEMGWIVHVIDPRPAFATAARFPEVDSVEVKAPEMANEMRFDPRTVAIVMTHHYRFDYPIVRALLRKNLRYLGLLGPKKRAEKILKAIELEGSRITPQMRETFHAPIGLDLGAGSPEQVALSIVAEVEMIFNDRDARPLRERLLPIHA